TMNITNPNGPTAGIGLNSNSISSNHIQDNSIKLDDLSKDGVTGFQVIKFIEGQGGQRSWQYAPALTLLSGGGISIDRPILGSDNTRITALDPSPTNELQSLSYNAATRQLSISQGNSTPNFVDLSSLGGGGTQPWTTSGSNIFNSNSGNVGIGISTPNAKLEVNGNIRLNESGQLFNIDVATNGMVYFQADGNVNDKSFVIDDDGDNSVMIGTDVPQTGFKLLTKGKAKFIDGVFFGNTEGFTDGGIGKINMNGSLIPNAHNTRDLGTSAIAFRKLFATEIQFGSNNILKDGGPNIAILTTSLKADGDRIRDLGTAALRYRKIFVDQVEFGSNNILQDGGVNIASINKTFRPETTDAMDLGTSAARWRRIFLINQPTVGSDARLKENIHPINYGLAEILKLNPVSYVLKSDVDKTLNLGLLAQEVQKIIPSIVHGDSEKEMLSITYTELIPVLINAIKEQQNQIAGLKQQKIFGNQLSASEIQQIRAMLFSVQAQK
ncbi:MAG: tail fiber domain-containing protein, partial [Bacteroidota bacterium]|nr:tail fiber domain-containing protein [Bacteroidota bacterium]